MDDHGSQGREELAHLETRVSVQALGGKELIFTHRFSAVLLNTLALDCYGHRVIFMHTFPGIVFYSIVSPFLHNSLCRYTERKINHRRARLS
jgi:hypothetical protein